MEELYKVMDDLLEVEFQMKAGMDILKELEEFYMLEKETEKSDARKVAVLMKGYLQSMKSNIREIIRYIDDTTLEKSNDKKKDKQESASTISEEVQEFVNLTITEHMGKAYSEWKLKQDKEPVSEIDKKYQKLLETLSQEQEEVITEYCNAIFSSGAETEEFFYRWIICSEAKGESVRRSIFLVNGLSSGVAIQCRASRIIWARKVFSVSLMVVMRLRNCFIQEESQEKEMTTRFGAIFPFACTLWNSLGS